MKKSSLGSRGNEKKDGDEENRSHVSLLSKVPVTDCSGKG